MKTAARWRSRVGGTTVEVWLLSPARDERWEVEGPGDGDPQGAFSPVLHPAKNSLLARRTLSGIAPSDRPRGAPDRTPLWRRDNSRTFALLNQYAIKAAERSRLRGHKPPQEGAKEVVAPWVSRVGVCFETTSCQEAAELTLVTDVSRELG